MVLLVLLGFASGSVNLSQLVVVVAVVVVVKLGLFLTVVSRGALPVKR